MGDEAGTRSTPDSGTGTTSGITPLGHEVFEIDTRMAGYRGITAGYLIRSDRPCLVETGTAPSAPVVRDALASLGVGPQDLATVVVTHIHLDHAGGVGDIAGMFPAARVVVHTKGARHLADPARLMASARMVYGDALDTLFGSLAPTPAERIDTVEETGVVDLGGGRRLDSHYSPGHAKHHVGLLDSASGDLYVGDAAGVYLPETGDLRAATPPPDFDLDVALASLRLFGALQAERLLFSHYGPLGEVQQTLERSAEEIRRLGGGDPEGAPGRPGPGPRGGHGARAHQGPLRGTAGRRRQRRGREADEAHRYRSQRQRHHALAGQDQPADVRQVRQSGQ